MNDHREMIVKLTIALCITAVILSVGSCTKRNVELSWQFDLEVIRAGYVQVQNVGAAGTHWIKQEAKR
jgi:hypothetical protein